MEKVASRKEKRKAARQEKKQHKHQALTLFKKERKQKQNKGENGLRKEGFKKGGVKERDFTLSESESDLDGGYVKKKGNVAGKVKSKKVKDEALVESDVLLRESDDERDHLVAEPEVLRKMSKKDLTKEKGKRTKFEELLEMETKRGASFEEDLETERRLAKKLKVKGGKLKDDGDELNFLFEGIPSLLDLHEDGDDESYGGDMEDGENIDEKKSKKKKKQKKRKQSESEESDSDVDAFDDMLDEDMSIELSEEDEGNETSEKNSKVGEMEYVESKKSKKRKRKGKKSGHGNGSEDDPSSQRESENNAAESGEDFDAKNGSENDTAEANTAQAIGKYVAPHLRSKSGDNLQEHLQIRRRLRGLLNRLSEANVESITGEISTIFQSVSRAVASQMISEEVLASCAGGPRGNEQYAAVFAAFVAGMACTVGMDFGARLMESLAKTFEEEYLKEDNLSLRNLSLLVSYLCMFGVCSSDLIYDFLIKLSKQLTEVDVSTILTILQCCGMKLRGDDPSAMKEFILSVQSRVKELKATVEDAEAKALSKRMEFMLETICDIKNNKKRTKDDSPQHTRIKKWLQKLRVDDITIRGVTWSKLLDPLKKGQWWFAGDVTSAAEDVDKVAIKIDKEVHEAQKMLQLASKLRMNTDTRRAIFCVIMSGEDYLDAFEKLLGLNLQGKQDREIMRVLVECCVQEKVFNKYYTALATKLCSHDKNHKFTLQYCLWDQFKELESMSLMRSMHLAKFVAEMVASFTLSLAVLKAVDLLDGSLLTAKRIMHFRMLFEAILDYPENVVWNVFTRVAVTPELEELRNGVEFFIREHVSASNKAVSKKFKLAKKALNNAEGVLM